MTSLLRYQEPPPNPKPLSTSHVWGVTTLYVVVKAAGNTAPPTLSESELAEVRWEPGPGRESDPRAESRPEVAGSAMARNVCGESAHPLSQPTGHFLGQSVSPGGGSGRVWTERCLPQPDHEATHFYSSTHVCCVMCRATVIVA